MKTLPINFLLVLMGVLLGCPVCVRADRDADLQKRLDERNAVLKQRIELSADQLQALVVAVRSLESLNYSEEQKKLLNYKVWVYSSGPDEIVVSFIGIPRKGDEDISGGNYDYAISTRFVIDSKTFVVKKTLGSR